MVYSFDIPDPDLSVPEDDPIPPRELLGPGDRVRVRGVMRGTVKLRQCVESFREGGPHYAYLVALDNGDVETYPAADLRRIGKAAPAPCEAETVVDRAWADRDEAERVARERALHLCLGGDECGDRVEIDWLDSD